MIYPIVCKRHFNVTFEKREKVIKTKTHTTTTTSSSQRVLVASLVDVERRAERCAAARLEQATVGNRHNLVVDAVQQRDRTSHRRNTIAVGKHVERRREVRVGEHHAHGRRYRRLQEETAQWHVIGAALCREIRCRTGAERFAEQHDARRVELQCVARERECGVDRAKRQRLRRHRSFIAAFTLITC
jgi:hypothetical protein